MRKLSKSRKTQKPVSRILLATSLLVVFFMITPIRAYANWVESIDSGSVQWKQVFSANQAVYVWGQIDNWDGFGFYARVYVTQDSAWSGGEALSDVTGGGFNTISSFLGGGAFLDELVWGPPLTIGQYDLVLDEDEDGFYDAGRDYVLGGALGSYAFRVTAPTGPNVDLSGIKAEASNLAHGYRTVIPNTLTAISALSAASFAYQFALMGASPVLCGIAGGVAMYIATDYNGAVMNVGFDIIRNISGHQADHYESLAADPPDPNFTEFAQLGPIDVYYPQGNSDAEIAEIVWANRLAEQAAITAALTSSIEKYQGARNAQDDYYTLAQAKAIKKFSDMLVGNLGDTAQSLSDLTAEVGSLGFDKVINADDVRAFQQRIDASGFTEAERQRARNEGMTDADITELEDKITGVDLTDMTDSTLNALLENIETASNNAIPVFQDLSSQTQAVINHYSAYVQADHPTADPGGPYAGNEGSPINLDGSASTDPNAEALTYAWDLDGDGDFDDASGAQVQRTWNSEFSGYVGLQVTNQSGLSNAAWAQVDIQSINDGPSIAVVTPTDFSPTVEPGGSLDFEVNATDPNSDPLSYDWDLDGSTVSTASTWTYNAPGPAPPAYAGGIKASDPPKIVTLTVSDGSPLSRDAVETWRIIIGAPQVTEQTDLGAGWNLTSLPVNPADHALQSVLASIWENVNAVWAYDANPGWKRYVVGGPDFLNDLTTVEPGKGYWIDMSNPDTLIVTGEDLNNAPISLKAGWNLVGYNSLIVQSRADAFLSIATKYNAAWRYDNSAAKWLRYVVDGPGFLNDFTQVGPWMGLWINAKEDWQWTISP